ncbi:Heterogeneous nuclear ribonucleoprotein 1 [Dendrobium catenatum]|uniref:Heterogeneous nuclear ribonucleoprotein 1 n=1 Tax=Dendrobium catenatum TaxID=906689 RepID=A0A2I0W6P6_9ASPA|nr:Heterogeneous nuclear ribonucleoprotein 1 [Dendrobium catenatum]
MRREDIPSCSYPTADFESHGGRMESDLGKVFIGGISWDTNEDCLREYFEKFGEVVEAVIMKDRKTGRARGFGFVAFADPAVAERVVMIKHRIDGRMVEAKKAIPRDDQRILLNRNNNSLLLHGSPSPSRIKKIFVGGLPSNITEADFKKYFERFGAITDAVVMYDHDTQRPRGFGFITFTSEAVVDRVLQNSFHELNGKMVEVKRAIPKYFSQGPTNYGLNRFNSSFNIYGQVNNRSALGSFGPAIGGRNGSPFTPGYEIGLGFEHGVRPSYGENLNLSSNIGYGQALSPYYSGNLTRFGGSIGYSAGCGNPGSSFDSRALNLWDNGDYNIIPASANSFAASGIGSINGFDNNIIRNLDDTFGFSSDNYPRRYDIGSLSASFTARRNYMDLYGSGSIYGDLSWHSGLNELDESSLFGYGLGATATDVISSGSIDYISDYDVTNRRINREG